MGDIKIESLVKRYGDVVALHGLNLHVQEGEFVALLGPSGCGKTTLLRAIAGLEPITEGSISIGGRVLTTATRSVPPEKRGLGMIFQSYALWPHMSVFDNIAFSLRIKKMPAGQVKQRIDEVLDLVGLSGLGDRYPSQLSGGQMQRVALARSIAPEPTVLLFDEPLSNLDSKLRERMRYELRELQRRIGTTAVYVTHDQDEAMVMSDRVVLMNHGEIQQVGTAEELYERPTSRFVADFLGVSNFVTAKLTEEDTVPGALRARVNPDLEFTTSQPNGAAAGAEVTLSIRPEHVAVRRPQPGEGGIRGRVTRLVYLGNLVDLFMDVAGVELRGQLTPDHARSLSEGDEVVVEVEPRNVRVVSD